MLRIIFAVCLLLLSPATGIGNDEYNTLLALAQKGDPAAQYRVGKSLYEGKGVERNIQSSFEWYKKSAEQGYVKAQSGLGWRYASGIGTKKDYKKAFFWYEKAAQQGYAKAQRPLGVLYEMGNGTTKDPVKAAYWYKKAADQGLARAQVNLGNLYESGEGVEKDFKQATEWYRRSTRDGYARGQTHLGRMYELGLGVDKDLDRAAFWYRRAATQGYEKAQLRLQRLQLKTNQDKKRQKNITSSSNTAGSMKERAVDLPKAVEPKKKVTIAQQKKHSVTSDSKLPFVKTEKIEQPKENRQLPVQTNEQAETLPPSLRLDLLELVDLVRTKNEQILMQEAEWAIKQIEVEKARAVFEPDLVLGFLHEDNRQLNNAEESVSRQFENVFEEKNSDYNLSIEGIVPTGAKVNLGYTMQRLSNTLTKSLTNQDKEYQTFWGVNLTQPLLKNAGKKASMAAIKTAEANTLVSFHEYRKKMTTIVAKAVTTFWELYLAQETFTMRKDSVKVARQILNDNQERFRTGKMAEIEVMEAEAGVAYRRSLQSDALQKLNAGINRLRSMFSSSAANNRGRIEVVNDQPKKKLAPDYQTTLKNAYALRPEYLANRKKIEAADVQLAYAKNQKWPQLDLKASYGLNGLDFTAPPRWSRGGKRS